MTGLGDDFVSYWQGQRPDLDPDVLALELTLTRLQLILLSSSARLAEEQGLGPQDYGLIAEIRRGMDGRPVRPSDLKKVFRLERSAITYRIDRLVELGYVTRATKPDDRRAIELSVTEAGVAVVDAIMTKLTGRLEDCVEAMGASAQDRQQLLALLRGLERQMARLEG
jgi:DNA-binding MarR family transcriptional regulator